ncbi:thioredoxin [Stigmatella aurantiaca]|uniref:Thioredoxin n=1 Tax=Stigmatella aurantiaca (strain DW4/3-1) TaxID=378806 RepID=Q091U8_STIAD|nr:thioredoxin [Stigmatella aurantiaca]ADO71899.1 Thioredoxin [Stigmatella aurantiaca DW4/3-1]EAU66498.1 thioredoxin [Stigmatella aurantiaca DW4/3-1]
MAGEVIEVGDAEFQREVLESQQPVLMDFTAAWCPPCRFLTPIMEALATEHHGRLKVTTLDVDAHQETARMYGIRSLPTLLLFKEGKVVKQITGAVQKAKLDEALRPWL